jgi:hypothetical protein
MLSRGVSIGKELLNKAMTQASATAKAHSGGSGYLAQVARGAQSLEKAAGSDLGKTIGRSI